MAVLNLYPHHCGPERAGGARDLCGRFPLQPQAHQECRDLCRRGFAPHHAPEDLTRLLFGERAAVGQGGDRLLNRRGSRGGVRSHWHRGYRAGQSYPEKSAFVKYDNGLRGLIGLPFFPIFGA